MGMDVIGELQRVRDRVNGEHPTVVHARSLQRQAEGLLEEIPVGMLDQARPLVPVIDDLVERIENGADAEREREARSAAFLQAKGLDFAEKDMPGQVYYYGVSNCLRRLEAAVDELRALADSLEL